MNMLARGCDPKNDHSYMRLSDEGCLNACKLYPLDSDKQCPHAGHRVVHWNGLQRYECEWGKKVVG